MKELMNHIFSVKTSALNVQSKPKPQVSEMSRQKFPWVVFLETTVRRIRDTGLVTEVALCCILIVASAGHLGHSGHWMDLSVAQVQARGLGFSLPIFTTS